MTNQVNGIPSWETLFCLTSDTENDHKIKKEEKYRNRKWPRWLCNVAINESKKNILFWDVTPFSLTFTKAYEEHAPSVFRVEMCLY
jgi:hypothetical protein